MEPFEVELAAFQEFFSVDKGLLHQKDSFTSKNSWSDLSGFWDGDGALGYVFTQI